MMDFGLFVYIYVVICIFIVYLAKWMHGDTTDIIHPVLSIIWPLIVIKIFIQEFIKYFSKWRFK